MSEPGYYGFIDDASAIGFAAWAIFDGYSDDKSPQGIVGSRIRRLQNISHPACMSPESEARDRGNTLLG